VWLSIIAYMVRIGARLGLVPTGPDSAESKAYVRAHDALHWLRQYLVGSRLDSVSDNTVCFWQQGQRNQIRFSGSQLWAHLEVAPDPGQDCGIVFDPRTMQSFELGEDSSAHFTYQEGGLNVSLEATSEHSGRVARYKTQIRFVVPLARNDDS
jgi:hypothetical protein